MNPNSLFSILLALTLAACGKQVQKEELSYLNGYWEIEKVTSPDGTEKEYKANTTVDYIEIENGKGFRKKVQPTLRGSYQTSDDAEFFTLSPENEQFTFFYTKENQNWEEVLLSLSEVSFSVRDQNNIVYNYKKFEPIDISK